MAGLHEESGPAQSGSAGIAVQKTTGLASSDKEKLRVFISHSRDDLDLADQLAAALDFSGFEGLIDREGIYGGEAWIDTSSCFSPSSARSEICECEVEEAARLNKRILPVICQPVEEAVFVFQFFRCSRKQSRREPAKDRQGSGALIQQRALDKCFAWKDAVTIGKS